MSGCATYAANPSFQIGAGPTGGVDCTAHACADAIDHATCGKKDPSGRLIRLLSDEPIPDPRSPGLNLNQVARVALARYGVYLEVRSGARRVTWAEYEHRRLAGQGCVIQLDYAAIADSRYDAGRGFRGGHAIFESLHATYDPLADGRARGVFRFDGTVYERALMRRAAGNLIVGLAGGLPVRVGQGYVWAAFSRDVVPEYVARIPAGSFWAYAVKDGAIAYRRKRSTAKGFIGACIAPRSYPAKGGKGYTLVELTSGSRKGAFVSANWAVEVGS